MEENKEIEEKKKEVISFFKRNITLLSYTFLAVCIFLAVFIRTRPLKINPATGKPGLWDVTTDNWTLGPDLDPFLFLRWMKYIVENGKLMVIDTMRYVPLGFETAKERILLPYSMAWFHKIAVFFGSPSVEYSAIIYPVFMFVLTVIACFLLTREIFLDNLGKVKANLIALISCFFLSTIPVLLPRTIAGIPEKESAAFFTIFLSLYFFVKAWRNNYPLKKYMFAFLAGISTLATYFIWGGIIIVYLTITLSVFFAFFINQIDKKNLISYAIWVIISFFGPAIFSNSLNESLFFLKDNINSIQAEASIFVLITVSIHHIIFHSRLSNFLKNEKFAKIPKPLFSFFISIILSFLIIGSIIGFNSVIEKVTATTHLLINPINSRFAVTVAENKQPYFADWVDNFGPYVRNIPVFFWLFFFGSILLCYYTFDKFKKKDKIFLTVSFSIFLFSLIFSKYSPDSLLNGINWQSELMLVFGFLIFFGYLIYFYICNFQKEEENLSKINFNLIVLFAFFFFGLIAARSAVRTMMLLAPSASIIVAFFLVEISNKAIKRENKLDLTKVFLTGVAIIILLSSIFAFYAFFDMSKKEAERYIPSLYTQQWQRAMAWVRENTSENAVFGHWWDYGYWLQSIGKRATALDGGNVYGYWNHLMGRHALTGPDDLKALEYLYTHNVTHFLIDSTDIGKYGAFSSIGSDVNYDRRSWIPGFNKEPSQTQETKNETIYVYVGGMPLEDDIIFDINGSKTLFAAERSAVIAVLVHINKSNEVTLAENLFIDCIECAQKGIPYKRYLIPIKYVYRGNKLYVFESNITTGIFIYPRIVETNSMGIKIDSDGSLLYLSNRTVRSQIARHYLFNEESPYFKLVHTEDDIIVAQLKAQYANFSDFVYYGGLRGPIKIWEIKYPENMTVKEEYLRTNFPSKELEME